MGDFLLDLSGQSHWWRTDARQLESEAESEGFTVIVFIPIIQKMVQYKQIN